MLTKATQPLDLVGLIPLMTRSSGSPKVTIALIDGPVATDHPDLASENIRQLRGTRPAACNHPGSLACCHGTLVAGVLCAKRASVAPAICPQCTLLVRPIFTEGTPQSQHAPTATPDELAVAIADCVDSGAQVINLSVGLAQFSSKSQPKLKEALDYSLQRGVIVVAAAGNQGSVGSSAITHHHWVIPVVSYDLRGRPMDQSNMGKSIGLRGVGAPGKEILSLSSRGGARLFGGTSAAAPFVTGAVALLWSEFPAATASQIKFAVSQGASPRRNALIPPLLSAGAAYQQVLAATTKR